MVRVAVIGGASLVLFFSETQWRTMFASNQRSDRMNRHQSSGVKDDGLSSENALWIGILLSCMFTFIIWVARPWLPLVEFLPDLGASWYYWKLPEQTTMGRITACAGYALHQLVSWGTIYYAQKHTLSDTDTLHGVNVFALASNILFIVLHFFPNGILVRWFSARCIDLVITVVCGACTDCHFAHGVPEAWVVLWQEDKLG